MKKYSPQKKNGAERKQGAVGGECVGTSGGVFACGAGEPKKALVFEKNF